MPWYKYLPKDKAEVMVTKGSVKIGTLFEYRNEEELGQDIGDKKEGVLTEWSYDEEIKRTQEDLNRIEKKVFRIGQGLKGVQIQDCLVQSVQKSSDLYIYSVSDVFSLLIMRKLSRDYHTNYDACVRINDPVAFVKEIDKAFKDKGELVSSLYCQYIERIRHYREMSPHPVIIKDPKYEYQKEIRTIWSPRSSEAISSEILSISELKNLCEIIFIDDDLNRDSFNVVKYEKQKFNNDRVLLDASKFYNCYFENCTLIYSGFNPVKLGHCEFKTCKWEFAGAASNTINFMKSLYHGMEEGKSLIEKTFENISSKSKDNNNK